MHLLKAKDVDSRCKITQCSLTEKVSLATQNVKAVVKFAYFLLEHNLPIASADCAEALLQSMFPDSEVARYYKSARTKISCIVDETYLLSVTLLPFALSLDSSNDKEEQKLVPLIIWHYENQVPYCVFT